MAWVASIARTRTSHRRSGAEAKRSSRSGTRFAKPVSGRMQSTATRQRGFGLLANTWTAFHGADHEVGQSRLGLAWRKNELDTVSRVSARSGQPVPVAARRLGAGGARCADTEGVRRSPIPGAA